MQRKCRYTIRSCHVIAVIALCLTALLPGNLVLAHGVELQYIERSAIEITARYDSGDPIAGAQVAVFAPGNPAEPWLTGTCDSAGQFFFTPDPDRPGLWEVQVRHAGHGGLIRVEVDQNTTGAAGTTGFTALKKFLMTIAVVWGLIGTALYFSRRQR